MVVTGVTDFVVTELSGVVVVVLVVVVAGGVAASVTVVVEYIRLMVVPPG